MLEQLAVEPHGWQVRGEIALDLDVRLPGRGTEEVHKVFDQESHISRLQLEVFEPSETEEIVGNVEEVLAFGL